MTLGDTLVGCTYDCNGGTVEAVDTILFHDAQRRVLYPDSSFRYEALIEGIGTRDHPFFQRNNCASAVAKGYIKLLNFCQGSFAECGLEVNATHQLTPGQTVDIFPNPTTSQISATLRQSTSQTVTVSLSDPHGRMLQRQSLPVGTTQIKLTVEAYTPGIYLLRVQSGSSQVVERVVVE